MWWTLITRKTTTKAAVVAAVVVAAVRRMKTKKREDQLMRRRRKKRRGRARRLPHHAVRHIRSNALPFLSLPPSNPLPFRIELLLLLIFHLLLVQLPWSKHRSWRTSKVD
jgi:small-conductance mechanosensitive channel